jgi:Mce-associated membrane protein
MSGGTVVTDESVDDVETPPEAVGETEASPAPGRRTLVRAVVVLLFVALVAGVAVEGWLLVRQHQHDVVATQALDAAKTYAVTLTSTDQNKLDDNFTAVLDGATGDFKDNYAKSSAQMRKMLIDNKVNTTGTVLDAAVKDVRGDSVDVLLAVKQVVTNSASPDPRTDFLSVSMIMQKVGDRWLAANVVLPQQ